MNVGNGKKIKRKEGKGEIKWEWVWKAVHAENLNNYSVSI